MALRKAISVLVIFGLAFAAWVVLFAAAGTSGIPVRQLLESTCPRAGFEVAQVAFQTENLEGVDYIVVGTPSFVARASEDLPKSAEIVRVPLSTVSLDQYRRVINVLKRKSSAVFIFQNAPHLWVDLDHPLARGSQNVIPWRLYKADLTMDATWAQAKETFNVLTAIVTKRCKKNAKGGRLPPEFLWASFLPEKVMSRRREDFGDSPEEGEYQARVIWVFDPDWIPDDAMDDTRQALINFASGPREEEGLGEFVSFDDFEEYIREPQPK